MRDGHGVWGMGHGKRMRACWVCLLVLMVPSALQAQILSPGEAKNQYNGWYGSVQGVVAVVLSDSSSFTIEAADRSSAIIVRGSLGTALPGDEMVVTGSLLSDKTFNMSYYAPTGGRGLNIDPVGLKNWDIVGAAGNVGLNNLDMYVKTWGRIIDDPIPMMDGSTRFHITDGSAGAPPVTLPAEGSVLFSDNFNSGKQPQWVDYRTATNVVSGQLAASCAAGSSNLAAVQGVSMADVSVSADATCTGVIGIILRFKDINNYLAAMYTPAYNGRMYFREVANGVMSDWLNSFYTPELSGTVHLNALAKGNQISLTVSNSRYTYRNIWMTNSVKWAGSAGLYHDAAAGTDTQYFDNFNVASATPLVGKDAVQVVVSPSSKGSGFMFRGDYVDVAGIAGKGQSLGANIRKITVASDADLRWMPTPDQPNEKRRRPTVTLCIDGTGDFGPRTIGTSTGGWQEAIDYCVANNCDLYIRGSLLGDSPPGPGYYAWETIHIPATRDFKIDGGECALLWLGTPEKPMIVIDSGENCHYWFGTLVYNGQASVLTIKPTQPVPGSGYVGFRDSSTRNSSVAFTDVINPGPRLGNGGIIFDSAGGPIVNNYFFFSAILSFNICVTTPNTGHDFAYNRFDCMDMNTLATGSTMMNIGAVSHHNEFELGIYAYSTTGVSGVDVSGSNNKLRVYSIGSFVPGRDVVFESATSGNAVDFYPGGDWGADPLSFFTDSSADKSNQVTLMADTQPVKTVAPTTGIYTYTQQFYPATIKLVGGTVTSLRLLRGSAALDYTGYQGGILMNVGDKIEITSSVAPSIQVVPT